MTSLPRFKRAGPVVCGGLMGLAIWFGAPELSSRLDAQSQPVPLGYGAAQAEQGQSAYVEHCASCHGQNMDDGPFAPPLKVFLSPTCFLQLCVDYALGFLLGRFPNLPPVMQKGFEFLSVLSGTANFHSVLEFFAAAGVSFGVPCSPSCQY